MRVTSSTNDRRTSPRHYLKIPLRIRLWKSQIPEQRSISHNLSLGGALFPTELPVAVGTVVELRLRMPEEISGKESSEWRCSGHVVRIDEPAAANRKKRGIAVQFDCYEVARCDRPAFRSLSSGPLLSP